MAEAPKIPFTGDKCETVFIEQVFPSMVNHYHTLFGGFALQWMDKAAWIVSTRFTRRTMVTVATDQVIFKQPVPLGSMVELRGRIDAIGKTSVTVLVELHSEEPLTGISKLATSGRYRMVALDAQGKPTPVRHE